MDVVLARPDRLARPSTATARHLRAWSAACSGSRTVSGTRLIVLSVRIEHRQVVRAQLERSVEQSVRVQRRIAAIGRDDVVQIRLRIGPVPLVITTLRSMPCGRGGAGGTSPAVMRSVQSANTASNALAADLSSSTAIMFSAGLARLQAPLPRLRRSTRSVPSAVGNLARRLVAELVAREAGRRTSSAAATRPGTSSPARCRCPPARCRGTRSSSGAFISENQ